MSKKDGDQTPLSFSKKETNKALKEFGAKSKVCPKCEKRKPLLKFGLRRMTQDGEPITQSYCKSCR